MKKSGVFMNLGRGQTVVEKDLVKALKEKVIAGGVLDVFYDEPLKPESELWDIPNLLMTPHCADITPDYYDRAMSVFIDNLERFARGDKLTNVCDKRLGY
jgi:phosphoglycerate dehydrogenase-like enzyme